MKFFGDSIIDAQLAAVSDSKITVAGTVRPCVRDEYHEDSLAQEGGAAPQKREVVAVELRTSAFPDLKANDEVDVDGVRYTIWDRSKIGDGGTTRLLLRVVAS